MPLLHVAPLAPVDVGAQAHMKYGRAKTLAVEVITEHHHPDQWEQAHQACVRQMRDQITELGRIEPHIRSVHERFRVPDRKLSAPEDGGDASSEPGGATSNLTPPLSQVC